MEPERGGETEPERRRATTGIIYALAAFGTWGLIAPVHFKLLAAVPPLEVLAQRIVWATLLVLLLIGAGRAWRDLTNVLAPGRTLSLLCISATLVAINWLTYIWAVSTGHLVDASLGYFMNPLVSVALGIIFLGERLRPAQIAACGLAGLGVLAMTLSSGAVPWIALSLAVSFGFYGLIRKTVPVEALIGFSVESLVLLPFALAYLVFLGATGRTVLLDGNWRLDLLLALTGATTSAPLIWFAAAARRLNLSTLGLLQYLAPTCILALGVFIYGEPFRTAEAVAFAAIWTALALYSAEALGFGARRS